MAEKRLLRTLTIYLNQNYQLRLIFPLAFHEYTFEKEDFNKDELVDFCYTQKKLNPKGIDRSNRGGWHSETFKLDDKNSIQLKFALELQKYILKTFKYLGWKTESQNIRIREMWAIINKKNDFNVIHTHPNCYLSAAYYVKAPKNCGKFIVENPNIAKRHSFPPIAYRNELNLVLNGLDINEGDLLLFPGYLPHKVGKNEADEDRIVISFNVDLKN